MSKWLSKFEIKLKTELIQAINKFISFITS